MRVVILSLVILVVLVSVDAFFPGLPLLSLKQRDDSSESDEVHDFKFPKLFGGRLWAAKKRKNADKDTLVEKIIDKKEDKFEDQLLNFFKDENKAKTIFEKLKIFKNEQSEKESEKEKPCNCKHRSYDDCEEDTRYMS